MRSSPTRTHYFFDRASSTESKSTEDPYRTPPVDESKSSTSIRSAKNAKDSSSLSPTTPSARKRGSYVPAAKIPYRRAFSPAPTSGSEEEGVLQNETSTTVKP